MKNNMSQRAARFYQNRRKKQLWYRIVSGMACVVVFCTVYALILPAITLEEEPHCGLEEHIHTEDCYTQETVWPTREYLCAEELADSVTVHTHDDMCYDRNGDLVCPLPEIEEHTHSADCWRETEVLTCGLEETGHIHDSACYTRVRGELSCGLEECVGHTHGSDCYEAEQTLVCGLEEDGEHTHDGDCYASEEVLTCALEESEGHTHSDACYDWRAELSCGREEDLEGHLHSADCYTAVTELVCGEEEIVLHTHNESCYDTEDCPLCEEEDAPEHTHPLICGKPQVLEHRHDGSCVRELEGEPEQIQVLVCGKQEHTHTDACYEEEVALNSGAGEQTYVCGLESHAHDDTCYNEAGVLTCALEEHAHGEECLETAIPEGGTAVYGNISELPDDAVLLLAEELAPTEQGESDAPAPSYRFCYEDDAFEMAVQLTGDAPAAKCEAQFDIVEGTEAEGAASDTGEDWTQGVVLAVIPQREDSEAYLAAAEYAAENVNEVEELCQVLAYEFYFFRDGAELDVTGCEVTVELSPKEEPAAEQPVMAASLFSLREAAPVEASAEADAGEEQAAEEQTEEIVVRFAILQETDGGMAETDSTLVSADEAAGTVMRFTLQSSRLAVTRSRTANPNFTVQYYARVKQVALNESGTLAVINTDNGGSNNGGKLPQNRDLNLPLKYLRIGSDGKIEEETRLEQVYRDSKYEYISAPNLAYFNRLYENGNYELKEIWVQNEGDTGWTEYNNPEALHFTNRESSANDNIVMIKDKTIIRLVYDTTSDSYSNEANFYDYDITDGKWTSVTNWTNTRLYDTKQKGINSAGNYSGEGVKLAFGNVNTGTDWGSLTWNGNYLNKSNSTGWGESRVYYSYMGCTFGLATSLEDGKIQYANGVAAPNLFNDGSDVVGKTTYNDNRLIFTRNGDAYTLASVSGKQGISAQALDVFQEVAGTRTNNFWPLDGVSGTVDPKFGDPSRNFDYLSDQYGGAGNVPKTAPLYAYSISEWGTPSGTFPYADNKKDHNNYFGLNYAVSFKLAADYVGPLNYLFFGDDDMWVFLTDSSGNSRLVCDIGGVHSSVGEYVNLWDYIPKDSRTEDESYTLSFFYTERGASGSTCYMHFTLPSVSSVTPEQTTGTLRVEKEVVGPGDPDQEFQFEIHFTDSTGNNLRDDYSYTRYDKSGTVIKSDIIIYDGGTFELKKDEYVVIRYLPEGTKYTITEQAADGYSTTCTVNSGSVIVGPTATGSVKKANMDTVHYINTAGYELPQTGGMGATIFYMAGGVLMAGAAILLITRKRMENKK